MFSNNILYAPYHLKDSNDTPIVIYVSLFGMMVVVMFATPFCVLPTKDSIEEVRNKKFSPRDNIIWTQILCWVSCALALPFVSITTPMQILGATTNSAIGFLLPIGYYVQIEKRSSRWTNMKITCYIIFVFICLSSVIELVTLAINLAKNND